MWRGGRDGGRVLAGGVGAWAIVVTLQQLLPTPASGAQFPATEPAVAAALSVVLADVVGRSHGWAAGARETAVAAMLVTIVVAAALVTADSTLTASAGGAALGLAWALALLTQHYLTAEPPASGPRNSANEDGRHRRDARPTPNG